MTTIKADIQAADRALRRACDKAVRMLRNGHGHADVRPVLEAAGITADVLMEAR